MSLFSFLGAVEIGLIFALVAFFVLLLTSLLLVLGYLQKQDYQSFNKLSQLPWARFFTFDLDGKLLEAIAVGKITESRVKYQHRLPLDRCKNCGQFVTEPLQFGSKARQPGFDL